MLPINAFIKEAFYFFQVWLGSLAQIQSFQTYCERQKFRGRYLQVTNHLHSPPVGLLPVRGGKHSRKRRENNSPKR